LARMEKEIAVFQSKLPKMSRARFLWRGLRC